MLLRLHLKSKSGIFLDMARKEACVYRTGSGSQSGSGSIPFSLPIVDCSKCQILTEQRANDSTCYNPDMNEKSCPISPQSRSLSENTQGEIENMSNES